MKSRWPLLALVALCLAPPLWADPPAAKDTPPAAADKGKTYQIPYRLTGTQHIMVRAKINGKGPFNFIVDTGAPMIFISVPAAEKAGLTPPQDAKPTPEKENKDKKGKKRGYAVTLDRFDLEGGASQLKMQAIVETPFQIEGMNAMGMPGEELHGMIGYTLLAHYRIELDLTRNRMVWTELDFKPPPPVRLGPVKDANQEQLEGMGAFMKAAAVLYGFKPAVPPSPRGFLGVELAEKDGAVTIKAVLPKTPAAKAGLRAGDRVEEVQGKEVKRSADVLRHAARATAGQTVHFTVRRGEKTLELKVTAGEGL